MSTIDEKLAGLEGDHGGKSKMQELTENNPNGLKGLVKNRYATTVAFSIGFGGLIYGYPTVGAVLAIRDGSCQLTLGDREFCLTSLQTKTLQPISRRSSWKMATRDGLLLQWNLLVSWAQSSVVHSPTG